MRDPGAVTVLIAGQWRSRPIQLVAALEALQATPDAPARVIVDERTGTVVVGAKVSLGPAAIGEIRAAADEAAELATIVDHRPARKRPCAIARPGRADLEVLERRACLQVEQQQQLLI